MVRDAELLVVQRVNLHCIPTSFSLRRLKGRVKLEKKIGCKLLEKGNFSPDICKSNLHSSQTI